MPKSPLELRIRVIAKPTMHYERFTSNNRLRGTLSNSQSKKENSMLKNSNRHAFSRHCWFGENSNRSTYGSWQPTAAIKGSRLILQHWEIPFII
jgi:hypothetical protein